MDSLEARPLLDRLADRVRGLFAWLPLTLAIAVSPGLFLWPMLRWERRGYLRANDLDPVARGELLAFVGETGLAVLALYALAWLWRRGRGASLADTARAINRWAFPVLTLPLVARLAAPDFVEKHPFFMAMVIVLLGTAFGVVAWRLSGSDRVLGRLETTPVRRIRWLAAGATALWVVAFCYFALVDHLTLGTRGHDLGIYDNLVWHTLHGDFLGTSLVKGGSHAAAHFDPLVAVFYAALPRAETLLVLQAVWLASGALPLYLIAKRTLESEWFAFATVLAWLLAPALHGMALYDFHSLSLAGPLILWVVALVERPGWRLALAVALLLACREDMALLALGIALYAFLVGRTRTSIALGAAAVAWLVTVKLAFMPDPSLLMAKSDETYSYASFYKEMIPDPSEGARGLVLTMLSNPGYTLGVLLAPSKVLYYFKLLWPLALLPLFSGHKRVLFVYGLLFTGLSSRDAVHSVHFQYSTVILPFLVAAVPDGLATVPGWPAWARLGVEARRLRWALGFWLVALSVLMSLAYGAVFPNGTFTAGFGGMRWAVADEEWARYRALREMIADIPADASVAATESLAPHVSNREVVRLWPRHENADYVLLSERGLKAKDKAAIDRLTELGTYEEVDRRERLRLLRRAAGSVVPEDPAPPEEVTKDAPAGPSPDSGVE
jgi:uncharacterized membrane protein